ncbi:DUF1996 domain-containing protein [Streptomyces rubradiris]|uniref:DUF1996 domain-containing protein n=1 Tax=Streptomyces rubradiris TaxID=285531 RepID=A0ABQ3R7W9_STRRR|nr:DUF1996 domain-containing protein [Streptomyces rubradiris]GHH15897.1 hypothetical protein GCM10018792_45010 [Streptomyces rubradiris]GHI51934.1 hypothetical protein Srubr_17800 [Streptomyces rubradiris]
MGRNTRKRRTPPAAKALAAVAALALGGGGLVWANVHASAHEPDQRAWGDNRTKAATARVATVSCPDVGQRLTDVPEPARQGVARELATLDRQITEAYARLAGTRDAQAKDPGFVRNAIVGPLGEKRAATIDRIRTGIQRAGGSFDTALERLAPCTTRSTNRTDAAGGPRDGGRRDDGGQRGGIGGQAGNGPVAADFVDITEVAPNVRGGPRRTGNASTGTFTTRCGVNANKNHNTDNVIVAPGVTNGAHHLHDYVGNQKVDAFASDRTLLRGGTSCRNRADLSSYYWPVVRVQDGTRDFDQNADGGGKEGNVGRILTPVRAEIKYVGSPVGKVVAMPRFLRVITGDAKATTNGPANANAHWSCTGFEDKVQLTDRYPICPRGSEVVRSFAFQSCWDGRNTDSANHRTHVAFADPASGACPDGFTAIPQLTMRLVYAVPPPVIRNGRVRNAYAVDGFPEQLHKAATDHDDFISVTKNGLADRIADCLNRGLSCA